MSKYENELLGKKYNKEITDMVDSIEAFLSCDKTGSHHGVLTFPVDNEIVNEVFTHIGYAGLLDYKIINISIKKIDLSREILSYGIILRLITKAGMQKIRDALYLFIKPTTEELIQAYIKSLKSRASTKLSYQDCEEIAYEQLNYHLIKESIVKRYTTKEQYQIHTQIMSHSPIKPIQTAKEADKLIAFYNTDYHKSKKEELKILRAKFK